MSDIENRDGELGMSEGAADPEMVPKRVTEPKVARAAFRDAVNMAATNATYVNKSAVLEGVDDLVSLVFGFSAGFPDIDGNFEPRVSVQPAVIGSRKMVQDLVNGIARNLGIVPTVAAKGKLVSTPIDGPDPEPRGTENA